MKFTKTINALYLSPTTIVNVVEGEEVPAALVEKYQNKLANVGAIKAPAEATTEVEASKAPAKSRSKKQEK